MTQPIPAAPITVDASDSACAPSATKARTGPSTFVITNNGSKVTEFYVYGEGDRVMGGGREHLQGCSASWWST